VSAKPISEIDELKMVYQEIIEGCTYSPKGFFIKHLTELEQIELTRKRIEFIQSYVDAGVPLEADTLTRLKEQGEWSNEKDEDIKAYRQTISDNEKFLGTIIPEQQGAIKKIIEQHKKSLWDLIVEKRTLVGTTAEDLSERDGTYFLAYLSLYRDRFCKERLFTSWEDFESLEEDDSQMYLKAIDSSMSRINDMNVRRIGALPFFLNAFSYCRENVHTFLNKPVCELTNYQVHLFSSGTRNLNILSQAEGNPPDYFDKVTSDEILKWYDTQYSIILGKRNKTR
jgi:hypothetical protein